MKATAIRIGKSKNESIMIDGEVILKKTVIGRWKFIARLGIEYIDGISYYYLKSATLAGIDKQVNNFPWAATKNDIATKDIAEVER